MNNPPVWEIPAFNWEIIRSDREIDILMRGLPKFCGMLTAPLRDSGGLTAPNEGPVLVIDSLSKALTYCRMKTSRCKDPGFCRKVGSHKRKIQLLPKNRFTQTKNPVAAEKSVYTNKNPVAAEKSVYTNKKSSCCRKIGSHKRKIQLLPKNRFPQTKSPVAAEKSVPTNKKSSCCRKVDCYKQKVQLLPKNGFHKQKIQLLPKNRFPQTKSPVAAEKSIATNKSTSAIHFQGIDPHTKFLAQFSKFDGMGPCFIKRSGHE